MPTTPTLQTWVQPLPHGIDLSCRAMGERGRPVLMFLHGFPEAAFVWDDLLAHFSQPENGGYRCVAPNLRGFEKSSAPADYKAYRAKYLMQDIEALIEIETERSGGQLACLIAHDWGGAVAWNMANQLPHWLQSLVIINSPHPGTFLRDLQTSPTQQSASRYMNFLAREDAPELLAQDHFKRLWRFLLNPGDGSGDLGETRDAKAAAARTPIWLTESVKAQYEAVWSAGLHGGCNLYRASPLRPATATDTGANAVQMPMSMLTISLPTTVIWGLDDLALPAGLIDGLGDYIPHLTLHKIPAATHWIVHEQPTLVAELIATHLQRYAT
jgi:epoxide hydrolase 4